MRFPLFSLLLLTINLVCAQVVPGFDKYEARDMIRICNSFTFVDLYNSDEEILPDSYKKYYTSGVQGMDNKFQIYTHKKEKIAVINLRGSTDKKISWMENLYAAMIPSKGEIEIEGEVVPYQFASDTNAYVHSGYALGIAYLSRDILFHINNINNLGIHNIIITGHSQGGALAQMLMAYLYYLDEARLSKNNRFKVYSFAAPKVGNQRFVEEYNEKFVATELSYLIINPADPVPKMPLSYKDNLLSKEGVMSYLMEPGSLNMKEIAFHGMANVLENKLQRTSTWFSGSVEKQISNDLGHVKMPAYVDDINYRTIGNKISLTPVEYPIHLKDSSILQNDSLMAALPRDENGLFEDKSLYETGNNFYQHKPYNYYVSVLKKYFPAEYEALEKKYLPENLKVKSE